MTGDIKQGIYVISSSLIVAGVTVTFMVNRFNKYNRIPGQDDDIDYKFRGLGVVMLFIGNGLITLNELNG